MDKGAVDRIIVSRLPQGGYTVRRYGAQHDFHDELAAFGDVDGALRFVKHCIEPVPAEQMPGATERPANCMYALQAAGKAYPRTCERCGLGPCPFGKPASRPLSPQSGDAAK